jgi:hypothetical protein
MLATGHIIGMMVIGAPTAIMLITAASIRDGVLDTTTTTIIGGIVIIKPSRGFIA